MNTLFTLLTQTRVRDVSNQTLMVQLWWVWPAEFLQHCLSLINKTYININNNINNTMNKMNIKHWKWNQRINTLHKYICRPGCVWSELWIIFRLDRWSAACVNECFNLERAAAHTCGSGDWILRRRADRQARQHNSICVQLCPCALGSCWFSWLRKD